MNSLKGLIILIIACNLSGCYIHNAGEPITKTRAFPKTIESAKKDNRQFIMYSGKDTFKVTSITIENAKREFTVHLDRVDSLYRANLKNSKPLAGKHIFLYMLDSISYTLDEPHTIPLTNVEKIQLSD